MADNQSSTNSAPSPAMHPDHALVSTESPLGASAAAPAPPMTIALLRALTALGPRLHKSTTAQDPQALYALVCRTLRDFGLFAAFTDLVPPRSSTTQLESETTANGGSQHSVSASLGAAGMLRVVAASIDDKMRVRTETLIGRPLIGSHIQPRGPFADVLAHGGTAVVEDVRDVVKAVVPQLGEEERARLVQGAQVERALLAAIVSSGVARGVLLVWGPRELLGPDDATAVGALAAQVGTALENGRLLAEAERERERWRATVEHIPEFVVTCDAEMRLTYVNPSYRRELGVPEGLSIPLEERVARFGLFLPDGSGPLPVERLPLRLAVTAGAPVRGIEVLHRDERGEERRIVWNAAPLRDPAGALLGAVAVGRDVTARRRMEREIAQHASQLEATFDAMVDAVALYDEECKVVRANAACRRLLGLDADPSYDQRSVRERMDRLSARTLDGRSLPREQWPMMRLLRGETLAEDSAGDFLVTTLDGRDVLLSPSGAPIRDSSGAIIGAVAIYRDVTTQRRMERELQQRASELESIFESITDGVTVYGPKGEVKYLNRAYRSMLALSNDELQRSIVARARAIFPRRPETDEPMPREEWPSTRLLAGEVLTGPGSVDVLVRAHDGRELLINCAGAPVRGEHGKIIGAVMVIRDVGERRRLEQRTQAALSALLEMAETLVSEPGSPAQNAVPLSERYATQRLADLTLRVLNCRHVSIVALYDPRSGASNSRASTSTGVWDTPEVQGSALQQRVYGVAIAGFPPEHVRDWWQRYGAGVPVKLLATPTQLARLEAGEAFFARARAREYRGEEFGITTELWVPLRTGNHLIGAMAINYGDNPDADAPDEPDERRLTAQDWALAEAVGKLVALVIERERLLREREEARANELALRQANERLDTFISLASHELRTPLTTIMANAQIAQRRAARIAQAAEARGDENAADVEKLAHLLERTFVAAERQNRLVADLLDVSRIHAGKLELHLTAVDLAALLRDAVEEQQLAHPERVITLRLPEKPIVAIADAERIHQVVANYLTNALKYAPPDQPIEVMLSQESGAARVEVRDRGPGIAREEHERIWERFYRTPDAKHLSGSGIGLGLGLYICHEIVERHDGTVGVESAPKRGSTFFFTLPLDQ